eukprot:8076275-Ditylum_brightwellii.AAC.1
MVELAFGGGGSAGTIMVVFRFFGVFSFSSGFTSLAESTRVRIAEKVFGVGIAEVAFVDGREAQG